MLEFLSHSLLDSVSDFVLNSLLDMTVSFLMSKNAVNDLILNSISDPVSIDVNSVIDDIISMVLVNKLRRPCTIP